MKKTLFLIRHGEALHNTSYKKIGEMAYKSLRDTKLTDLGEKQATEINTNLNTKYTELKNIDIVLTSPLMRTLQTTERVFKNINKPILVMDCLKEYPQSDHICNKRMDVGSLKNIYPGFDFTLINKDNDWNDSKRTEKSEKILLKRRIEILTTFIKKSNHTTFAIVGHCSYFNMLLEQFEDKIELKHAYPYKIIFNA
jgi:broad specificity phosphatase PhoE